MANPGNVIGGYKATLNNPNVGEEAKANAQEIVDNYEQTGEVPEGKGSSRADEEKNTGNVVGGHKANLKNPNTSDESKAHSEQVLKDLDA